MLIKIKFVDDCRNKAYGTTEIIDKNTILIVISRNKNRNRSEFFVTMLHELLHAWMFVLKANGIHMSQTKEHKWIYLVQNSIVEALGKIKRKR
jgi:Zn-dependent peptidase ImmA (M78 family)